MIRCSDACTYKISTRGPQSLFFSLKFSHTPTVPPQTYNSPNLHRNISAWLLLKCTCTPSCIDKCTSRPSPRLCCRQEYLYAESIVCSAGRRHCRLAAWTSQHRHRCNICCSGSSRTCCLLRQYLYCCTSKTSTFVPVIRPVDLHDHAVRYKYSVAMQSTCLGKFGMLNAMAVLARIWEKKWKSIVL